MPCKDSERRWGRLCSLAFQLAERLPAYRAALEAKELTKDALDECRSATAVLCLLFKEPMEGVEAPEDGTRLVILIDALDDCEHGRENKILDCTSKDFASVPSWLGVFITTRPKVEIWEKLIRFVFLVLALLVFVLLLLVFRLS